MPSPCRKAESRVSSRTFSTVARSRVGAQASSSASTDTTSVTWPDRLTGAMHQQPLCLRNEQRRESARFRGCHIGATPGRRRMCGIVGLIHADRDCPVSPRLVREMCEAIRHRGPDDEGAYVDGPVGLGMRRLSIIDLAGGRQPIFNEDRSKVIVFNGELYNYRELRRDLVARGHGLTTHGDTETILHLYEDEGADCVRRLRGMFAFAIWDATAQTLLLARDRFGIKPLYFTAAPWGVAFASELKALHAAGLTDRALDWDALDMYFQLGYIPAPATPFGDVQKLEPGHTAMWRRPTGLSIRRY